MWQMGTGTQVRARAGLSDNLQGPTGSSLSTEQAVGQQLSQQREVLQWNPLLAEAKGGRLQALFPQRWPRNTGRPLSPLGVLHPHAEISAHPSPRRPRLSHVTSWWSPGPAWVGLPHGLRWL